MVDTIGYLNELDSFIKNQADIDNTKFVLRVGSSLHPSKFTAESDIDYIFIVDELNIDYINNFPRKVSGSLDKKKFKGRETLKDFYWRMDLENFSEHKVTVIFYTFHKFMRYLTQRSGAKIYLLHDHLLLIGDKPTMERYKKMFAPNRLTAQNDLWVLKQERYNAGTEKFLWAWRSVALIKSGYKVWLKDKEDIELFVEMKYNGKIKDKKYLVEILEQLLNHANTKNKEDGKQ